MRSLKKLNAAAGTSYTRWKQVVAAVRVCGCGDSGHKPESWCNTCNNCIDCCECKEEPSYVRV